MNSWPGLKGKVSVNKPLKDHTSLKIGGAVEFFIEPSGMADLKTALALAKKNKRRLLILGSGSNILASDKKIKGAVIKLSSTAFKKISLEKNLLSAGAGVKLNKLLDFARSYGMSGLEFLSGIPGSLGGAIMMNAGAHNKNISDLLENITLLDYNSKLIKLQKRSFKFGYRSSGLSGYIILGAQFRLVKKDRQSVVQEMKKCLDYRKASQELNRPSAGCFFRNPQGASAGKLIDLCGLKGKSVSGAAISNKHANFIVNTGNARAVDMLKLASIVKKKVKSKFKIELKPEVIIWR